MRAIVVREFGGPDQLRLEEVAAGVPGPQQVRVRVHAIGVNPFDTYMRTGQYAIRPALPYTPGADAAGVVDAVGPDVSGVKVGDRVYVGGTAVHSSYGAYAEQVVCRVDQVHPLPDRVSFAQGAAVNVPYVTASYALHTLARVRPGDTVFVHGASGAVGLAATQMATALGATVIGTAGTAEGLDLVRAQGAATALNHHDAGYLEQLSSQTAGRGPDVILEMLANVNLNNDLAAAAPGARIVIIGNRGTIEIDPRRAMTKMLSIFGMARWQIPADDVPRIHAGIGAGLRTGVLSPVVGQALPLSHAAEAHALVMASGSRGKIVLIPE